MAKKLTQAEFISRSKHVHGDKYDYSKVAYNETREKVCIICLEHGEFWQTPYHHMNNHGCPMCQGRHKTTEQFIDEANKVHNNKYNYSKTNYVNSKTKIIIICPEHGEFLQSPNDHLQGYGCKKCFCEKNARNKADTTEQFVKKAISIHGNKYDYSKVDYINNHTNICIICPKHGEFWQIPSVHLSGSDCIKCSYENRGLKSRNSQEEVIKRFKEVHGDKYDYSKVDYVDLDTKVTIICPIHGEFLQSPWQHLNTSGCSRCVISIKTKFKPAMTYERWIQKVKEVHGNKYDYSKTVYINGKAKVEITCHKHGSFWQLANNHLRGSGCFKCSVEFRSEKAKTTILEFIQRANQIHNEKYDYSLIENIDNQNTKVCIICPIHGEFWQKPAAHLNSQGCPICKESKGEIRIRRWLEDNNIEFIPQYKFKECKNTNELPFDFYLPTYNILIEFDGIAHFQPVEFFGGKESFEYRKQNDSIKTQYCKDNKIKLLRISYVRINHIEEILEKNLLDKAK